MPSTAGNYEFRLFSNDSYSRLATSGSVTVGGGGTPSITVSPTTVAAGGTVTASWNGIVNPTASDWIGLFVPTSEDSTYLDWIYVSCSKSPSSARASGSCPFTVPASVAPGNYELRLYPNNMYTVLATSNPLNVGTSTAGTLQFSSATYGVAENGGNAMITITRAGGSAGAVSVMFATSNGTAMAGSDYTATTQTVNFSNGDTANKTVSIPILDDTVVEGSETVNLALSSPTGGATLGNPSTATLTITDNDGGPTLTVSPATILVGGSITASWSGIVSPTAADWIGLYAPGAANTAYVDWIYVSCSKTAGTAQASGSCSFTMSPTLPAGTYELRLLANNGFTRLATSNTFSVTTGTGVSLSASPTTIARGGTVTATWNGIANATATDWIGLYAPGAANTSFVDWIYVSCSKSAGSARPSGSCGFTVPTTVTPGTYQLRLLANNGFGLLATSNSFTVQ